MAHTSLTVIDEAQLVPLSVVQSPFYSRNVYKQIGYDGQNKRYWVVDDTFYHWDTPDDVISILETCRKARKEFRIELTYGDVVTGLAWEDGVTNTGYIGRSTGWVKIPLLIWNARSYGGPGILENCIVRIRMARGKRVLYQHPRFHTQETWADKYLAKRYPQLYLWFIRLENRLLQFMERHYGPTH